MATPLDLLPAFRLNPASPVAREFAAANAFTFRAAASHVWRLPYGRTTDRANPTLVLTEGKGTCTTKHALLVDLAGEHGHRLDLVLGIYLMSEANTPGVGSVLAASGLDAIPEAHCYIRVAGRRVDLTHPPDHRPGEPIADFLHEEAITVAEVRTYKPALHRRFLDQWSAATRYSGEELWAIREACIDALCV